MKSTDNSYSIQLERVSSFFRIELLFYKKWNNQPFDSCNS